MNELFLKHHRVLRFFAAMLLLAVLYRSAFFLLLYQATPYYSIDYRLMVMALGFSSDLLCCICLASLYFLLRNVLLTIKTYMKSARLQKIFTFLPELIALLLFMSVAIIYITHLRVFSSIFIGLSYTILISSIAQGLSLLKLGVFYNKTDVFFCSLQASFTC